MTSMDDPCNILKKISLICDNSTDPRELLQISIHGINNGSLSLHNVVESLEPSLTSQNASDRSLGVKFLADVIHTLPREKLNSDELSFFSLYLCDRLNDHHATIPGTLHGMLALVNQINISMKSTQDILRALFRDFRCQSFPSSERRAVYKIINACFICKLDVIKAMGSEFIAGFISAIDGERDPQNLVLIFSLYPMVATTLPLDAFCEEMFEVVAAYFPIDYVPPVHNQYEISSEDLITGLRKCLSSTDQFAQYCLPLLQEKVESDLISAKLDSLCTLASCAESYSAPSMQTFILPLWNCIRRTIIEASNAEVEAEALTTLSAIIACIERGPSNPDRLESLVNCAIMECFGHLSVPENRLMFTSAKILLALMSPSEYLTRSICPKVLSLLVDLFNSKDDKMARKIVLEISAKFINQMAKFNLFGDEMFSQLQIECWQLLHSGLKLPEQMVVMTAAVSLSHTRNFLKPEQASDSAKLILDLLLECPKEQEIKTSYTSALVAVVQENPVFLSENIIPDLLSYSNPQEENLARRGTALDLLSVSVSSPELALRVVPQLWASAGTLLEKSTSRASSYYHCIKKIIQRLKEENMSCEGLIKDWGGVAKCVSTALRCIFSESIEEDFGLLEELSSICQKLVDREMPYMESLVYMVAGLPGELDSSLKETIEFQELELYFGRQSSHNIYPLCGLLLSSVSLFEFTKWKEVMLTIQKWSLESPDQLLRTKASQLFSALINKADPDLLNGYCEDFSALFSVLDCDHISNSSTDASSHIFLLGWIVKALVMRGHYKADSFTSKLEALLLKPVRGSAAASCYSFILTDYPDIFKEQNGAIVTLFYKQRFFQTRIDGLVNQFNISESQGKFNTLLAISHLTPLLPRAVIKTHLKTLLPVLIQGLRCPEPSVVDGSTATLCSILSYSVDQVGSHVGGLIKRLFEIYSTATLITRLKCLGCLEHLVQLPELTILPYKSEVLLKLKGPLDDRKRVARRQAAVTKCRWVLVGSPKGT